MKELSKEVLKKLDTMDENEIMSVFSLGSDAKELTIALNSLDQIDDTVWEYVEKIYGDNETAYKKIGEAFRNYRDLVVEVLTLSLSKSVEALKK